MILAYIIPVHNEALYLINKIEFLLASIIKMNSENLIILVENGSTDESWAICLLLANKHPEIKSFKIPKAGLGLALREGTHQFLSFNKHPETLIVYTAADLPFGLTDLENYFYELALRNEPFVGIGSKFHPKSQIKRSFTRWIISIGFYYARILFLRLPIKDSQGSILAPVSKIETLIERVDSEDYFFSTEFLYYSKMSGHTLVELPVKMGIGQRKSSVHIIRDTFRMFKQILRLFFKNIR